jgi:polyhydroxyalkanoate synthesis regulator phasin
MSSLIPERPLVISPSLATTIGLEEACLLSVLSDISFHVHANLHQGRSWYEVNEAKLHSLTPFWNAFDIQRIARSLQDKGLLQIASAPFSESRVLQFTLDAHPMAVALPTPIPASPAYSTSSSANFIAPNWQPDQELWRQIAQYNIPADFVRAQIPEFVTYWRERGETSHSWGAKFLKDILHKWRHQETLVGRQKRDDNQRLQRELDGEFLKRDQEIPMHAEWRPNQDALEVLVKHAGISLAFVEDSIPEFVVYWKERGDVGKTWNTKFIQHVKRQWARYSSALEHDSEPKRIPDNWQPSRDVYDVLKLANIDLQFAQRQVPEFMLFWRDSNQVHSSWNTKFLQHVKFHWAKQHALITLPSSQVNSHAGQQFVNPTTRTKDSSLTQQLTDRSWAS